MASPFITQLADALVLAMNAQFPTYFVARRTWSPDQELEEYPDNVLTVVVAPMTRVNSFEDRGHDRNQHALAIGFRQRIPQSAGTQEELRAHQDAFLDDRSTIIEAVADWLARRGMGVVVGAQRCPVLDVQIDPICAPDDLRQSGLFTSVIQVTFRERRTIT